MEAALKLSTSANGPFVWNQNFDFNCLECALSGEQTNITDIALYYWV